MEVAGAWAPGAHWSFQQKHGAQRPEGVVQTGRKDEVNMQPLGPSGEAGGAGVLPGAQTPEHRRPGEQAAHSQGSPEGRRAGNPAKSAGRSGLRTGPWSPWDLAPSVP